MITKQIEVIGSAITLVGERIQKMGPELIDDIVANMILSTVSLDTFNFDPKLEHVRWVYRDKEIFDYY
jgi:hypothetical protein